MHLFFGRRDARHHGIRYVHQAFDRYRDSYAVLSATTVFSLVKNVAAADRKIAVKQNMVYATPYLRTANNALSMDFDLYQHARLTAGFLFEDFYF